jgi:hypothetical protein
MLEQLVKLPIRKRVGILAIILGFLAIFAGNPYEKTTTRVNVKELSSITVTNENSINVYDLADWIIKEKLDYRLIDLRDENKFAAYNIPGSECIPIRELFESKLMRNEKIILCSDGDALSTQAWFLLKANDYKSVYIIKGGLKSWEDEILFPELPSNPSKEQLAYFEKIKEVSKFFGGEPRSGNQNTEKVIRKIPETAPSKITITKKKKKSREGC